MNTYNVNIVHTKTAGGQFRMNQDVDASSTGAAIRRAVRAAEVAKVLPQSIGKGQALRIDICMTHRNGKSVPSA